MKMLGYTARSGEEQNLIRVKNNNLRWRPQGPWRLAPFQAVGDSIDVADKTKSAGAGLSSYPGNAIVRVVSNPFKAVAEVGEAMWGKD
uniref:Uncharacterized protein n=1 Tax=Magallana gigas TaxID=29159 RepID=A0A8W8I0X3_MAGGI